MRFLPENGCRGPVPGPPRACVSNRVIDALHENLSRSSPGRPHCDARIAPRRRRRSSCTAPLRGYRLGRPVIAAALTRASRADARRGSVRARGGNVRARRRNHVPSDAGTRASALRAAGGPSIPWQIHRTQAGECDNQPGTARGRTPAREVLAIWQEYRRTGDRELRDRLIFMFMPMVRYIVYRKVREVPAAVRRRGLPLLRPGGADPLDRPLRPRQGRDARAVRVDAHPRRGARRAAPPRLGAALAAPRRARDQRAPARASSPTHERQPDREELAARVGMTPRRADRAGSTRWRSRRSAR